MADIVYRPNVCAVVVGPAGTSLDPVTKAPQVMVFHRINYPIGQESWQFPQGGLEPGEAPQEGLLRELEEEIGTREVRVLGQAPAPVRYVYPPAVHALLTAKNPKKAMFQGQEQHWFLVQLMDTRRIHFRNAPPEFDAWRWVTPAEAMAQVVYFKREAYQQGLSALGLLSP